MLARLQEFMERRNARSFVENMKAWYQTSLEVSDVMGDALHDTDVSKKEIGYVIDEADRMLLSLRYYIPEAHGGLRRRNPELAKRFDKNCQKLYQLRNEVIRFLIRSQGPGPMSGEEPNEEARLVYYYRALDEVGFKARDLKKELDQELRSIWPELQVPIVQAESIANYS